MSAATGTVTVWIEETHSALGIGVSAKAVIDFGEEDESTAIEIESCGHEGSADAIDEMLAKAELVFAPSLVAALRDASSEHKWGEEIPYRIAAQAEPHKTH